MIELQVTESVKREIGEGWLDALIAVAEKTLLHQEILPIPDLTLLLTDDSMLHHLNKTYRSEDKPTDVLSFENELVMPDGTRYLGDIAISIETAKRQAEIHQKSVLAELELLTTHGVLHLLGYDHAEPEEEARMWAIQSEILNR